MKAKSISYQQTNPTGNFANERIGIEIELSEGDTPEEAFAYAKEMVEKIHRDNNPQLYGFPTEGTVLKVNQQLVDSMPDVPRPMTAKEKKEAQIQSTIKQIQEITDPKVLESFKLIASKNPELQTAYNNKEKELKQGSTKKTLT